MSVERRQNPKPYEVFGITEDEVLRWRVDDAKFIEIITNSNTTVYSIETSSNNYGEFLFVTAGRGTGAKSIYMTFWGLGYHEYRERWIHNEWFWHQTPASSVDPLEKISQEEALEHLERRKEEISPHMDEDTQTELGKLFEVLADLTDDDAALAEMQDLGLI